LASISVSCALNELLLLVSFWAWARNSAMVFSAKKHDDESNGHGHGGPPSRRLWKVGHLHCSGFRNNSGSLAKFAAIRRASSSDLVIPEGILGRNDCIFSQPYPPDPQGGRGGSDG
jgi:hypothetical protein